MESISITVISLITGSGVIGAILGYYLYKRKNNAEAATQEATAKQGEAVAVESNLKIYQELINDLRQQFETRIKEVRQEAAEQRDELEAEIKELKIDLEKCKREYLKSA